jgi:pathogenesis-related protein 1
MKGKTVCKFPGRGILVIAFLLLVSTGLMKAGAQTKKIVLKDFTFYPLVSQQSKDNPLVLPYESKSTSITVQVDATEDYETVQDFLDYYESPLKKSRRVETVNGLQSGWIIEESEDDPKTWVLAGMVKHNPTGDRLFIVMLYPAKNVVAEKNALTMFRSFRHNPVVVTTQPVVTTRPGTNPANTNPANSEVNTQQILAAHNVYRSELGIPPLTWSASLASYAQAWANELANNRNCQMAHRPHDDKSPWNLIYGENIFSGSAGYTFPDAVKAWGDEKKLFDHKTKKCTGEWWACGHYTQVIWKNTTQVGCAIAKCANGSVIIVCNYNPAGNYSGQPPY